MAGAEAVRREALVIQPDLVEVEAVVRAGIYFVPFDESKRRSRSKPKEGTEATGELPVQVPFPNPVAEAGVEMVALSSLCVIRQAATPRMSLAAPEERVDPHRAEPLARPVQAATQEPLSRSSSHDVR